MWLTFLLDSFSHGRWNLYNSVSILNSVHHLTFLILQTANSIETNDTSNPLVMESSMVSTYNTLSGGSSNPPKFGTLIPNRIFVGGIPSNVR